VLIIHVFAWLQLLDVGCSCHASRAFVQQSVDAAHAVVLAGYIAQSTYKLKLVMHLRFMHFLSTFRGRRSSKKQFLLSTFELYGIHHASFHCRKPLPLSQNHERVNIDVNQ